MFPVFPSLLQQCKQPEIPILDDVELIISADNQKKPEAKELQWFVLLYSLCKIGCIGESGIKYEYCLIFFFALMNAVKVFSYCSVL